MSDSAQTRLPWTAEEDSILIDLVQKYGEKRWNMVANGLPGRTGKGCSHRWRTYLRPDVKHPHLEPFTEWEAAVIVQAQRDMGNNWLAIAKLLLPGRSNTAVKNFWHCRLKSGSGTHTNRFIVENYNLRYLLNEVAEKDRLHPVALPAFPSTAPTGHVRRQIHPRPRQEAAAQAAAAAEAALMAQQIAAQAQAMGMDPQTYMQQAGLMDPTYAAMYGYNEQMAMSQQSYGPMPSGGYSSKEQLKQQASEYVQQQLALMGHPPTSRHASGGGSSRRDSAAGFGGMGYSAAGWAGGYDGTGTATAAGGVKKPGRGRGRPPGSKNQTHSNTDTGLDTSAAAAAAAAAAEQQLYQQQQQYSMAARASQDEAATWCSTGMVLAGSAAAAGAPHGSPGGEVHSSATYMVGQHMAPSSAAADPAGGVGAAGACADPLDPAALAAAPVPLGPSAQDALSGAAAADAAHPAAGEAAGPDCCGLLPTSAAAAAELNRYPGMPGFRVSMTGLDFELEAAGGGGNCVRFSSRSLKLLDYEDGACMPGYKASYNSIDFRTSLNSFDEIMGNNAANRMSEHTHIGLRGPSWDGGNSPRSQPSDTAAAATAAGSAGSAAPAAAAAAGYAHGSTEADNALTAAFKQQQTQQQVLMPPPGSAAMGQAPSWVAASQPPNSAAAAAAAVAAALPATLGASLTGVNSGSFSFPVVSAAQDDIHPGAIAAPAGDVSTGSDATPFGAAPLQAAPFSPVDGAGAGSLSAQLPAELQMSTAMQLAEQRPISQPMGAPAAAATDAERAPPAAPRMPPAFHSVLQALQPPAAPPCSSAAATSGPSHLNHIKAEPQQQQYQQQYQHQQQMQHQQQHMQMQPMSHESALAAASPAITGLTAAAGGACAMSMAHAGFMLPAAAAGAQHFQQQQMPMPMPLPLPLQLLVPPQHQQAPGQRASDLNLGPLPSPIDLFHGDHGLHADDLLIGTEDVFDERMLCTGHSHQHHQQQQQAHQQQQMPHAHALAGAHMLRGMNAAQLVNHTFSHYHPAAAAGHMRHMQEAGAAATGLAGPNAMQDAAAAGQHFSAGPGSMRDLIQHSTMQHHPTHAPGLAAAAAGGQQEHPDASARQGVKRRRSSANGGSTWSKKQRPSDGSLVEVYRHGMDDCLHFWHHD